MEFGRIHNYEDMDYTLADFKFYQQHNKSLEKKLFLGCPVWNDPGFKGKIYPADCDTKDFLFHYSRNFNSIEVNSTFYAIPSEKLVQKWDEVTPGDFKFCLKFPKGISHSPNLGNNREMISKFLDTMEILGQKAAFLWLQLPPHFDFRQLENLHKFIRCYQRSIPLAVELRHPEWFQKDNLKHICDILAKYNTTFIITDTPGRRDVLHQCVTSDKLFIRFTGNNLHETDFSRLDKWTHLLKKSFDKISDCHFFFHQPNEHFGFEMATHMLKSLQQENFHYPQIKQIESTQPTFDF